MMLSPRWLMVFTALAICALGLVPARAVDPSAYLDSQTFLVVRLRPAKVDLTKAVGYLSQKKIIDQGQALAAGLVIGTIKASIDRNVEEMWIGMNATSLESADFFPIIMIPKRDDEQVSALKSLLGKVPGVGDLVRVEEAGGMVFMGSEAGIKAAKSAKGKPRADLAQAMKAWNDEHSVQIAFIPTADQRKTLREMAPQLAGRIPDLKPEDFTDGIEWGSLSLDVFPPRMRLFIKQADGKAAAKALNFMQKGMDIAPKMLAQNPDARDIVDQVAKVIDEMKKGLKVENDGLVLEMENPQPILDLVGESAKKAQEAAKRMQSGNNMKQIGMAFHNLADGTGKGFTSPAIMGPDGKALLSWRVKILPFIEEDRLYKKFKLDEPWDSTHNKRLINSMPKIYLKPDAKIEAGKTVYVVPTGKGTLFATPGKDVKFSEITDGTSNTILAVELPASRAVTWTRPDDWEAGAAVALDTLMAGFKSGFNALYADGSVRYLKLPIAEKDLRGILSPDGGEVINLP